MKFRNQNVPTGSVEAFPTFGDDGFGQTPGLVLVYSKIHAQLPSAVALEAASTTIGREADNDLSIPESAVSRYHAILERRNDGGVWLIDRGSTNGIIVNGTRTQAARLYAHDLIRIGDAMFRFAEHNASAYVTYRLDGSVDHTARPVRHRLVSGLVGGFRIDELLDRVDKVARTTLACVIHGESGTGKELLARTIHDASGRSGPFRAINCAALPPNLIDSELFGYRKGAFTGATQDKPGLVRTAHLGTLFLDEIGDMPPEAQSKLLRVLQEREVLPIGATEPEKVDVRVVSATHRDLEAEVAMGRFRGDLLARLREFVVRIPPLRERREDLYSLTRHFLKRAGRPDANTTLPFMLGLAHHAWPYNVRELESAMKLSVALADGVDLDIRHLPDTIQHALRQPARLSARPPPAAPSYPLGGEAPTEHDLRALLSKNKGNIAAVGRELGKERMQVHRWLKRYAINIDDYRD
jgi:DNA-binding NtrC family response regulator